MKTFNETLHNGFQACYEVSEIYFHSKTGHQELIIFSNPLYGRIMALDGVIQTTEKDEFIYHEMFAHVPLLSHPNPKKVLIVGGGDGGLLREVCKYSCIESITMVEIDESVVEISKQYLPKHSQGSFNDKRLNLVIADGLEFVRSTNERFDVILSDSTDPIGPGEALFAENFYECCAKILNESGILVTQNGVSFLQTEELVTTKARMQEHFKEVKFYQADVPTYVAGNMNYAWASKNVEICIDKARKRLQEFGIETNYFTPELYQSAFNLPKYIQQAIEENKIESI